jgi:hypothetical protein
MRALWLPTPETTWDSIILLIGVVAVFLIALGLVALFVVTCETGPKT